MISYSEVKPSAYYDSVTLMLFSSRLLEAKGIKEAAVMMGTDHNKALMIGAGVLDPAKATAITPNDLVIGILGEDQQAVENALKILDQQFCSKAHAKEKSRERTLDSALKKKDYNFAVISLPGKYAKHEAMKAMCSGLHVLLFSDNVPLEEEIELKEYAAAHNLLMMGPDCGTAIIGGVALGFANVVRRGNIGLVAAAGTGLQEVTVLIDRLGGGISQALGTGGRDMKEEVGGRMMLLALDALKDDPETKVIGIISKPPTQAVMDKILENVSDIGKPVVACFLGGDPQSVEKAGAVAAATLQETSCKLVEIAGGNTGEKDFLLPEETLNRIAKDEIKKFAGSQKYIRGLYSGGTLCFESILLFQDAVGSVYSNIAVHKKYLLGDVETSEENTLIDMGDDYFTDGMPHPMIDMRLRVERIKREAADENVAVILLDCVLGYGCHSDPAGALAHAITSVREMAKERHLTFIASVCGTPGDAQDRTAQEEKLRNAGVIVLPSNAQAAKLAAKIIAGIGR